MQFMESHLHPGHCAVVIEGAIAEVLAAVGQEGERPVHLLQRRGVAGGDIGDEGSEVPGRSIDGLVVGVDAESMQLSVQVDLRRSTHHQGMP